MVANGSLDELRAGIALAGDDANEKLTLEEIFLRIVGGSAEANEAQLQELSWLA
jgi:hypothetical protein